MKQYTILIIRNHKMFEVKLQVYFKNDFIYEVKYNDVN